MLPLSSGKQPRSFCPVDSLADRVGRVIYRYPVCCCSSLGVVRATINNTQNLKIVRMIGATQEVSRVSQVSLFSTGKGSYYLVLYSSRAIQGDTEKSQALETGRLIR